MGGNYFRWTDEAKETVAHLRIQGMTHRDIAATLSKTYDTVITCQAVENLIKRNFDPINFLEIQNNIPHYKELSLPMGNYMISCDYHAPFHSELWFNRMLAVARKLGIRKQIIVGDLFDMAFVCKWPLQDGQKSTDLDEEKSLMDPIFKAMDYFDENVLINGNHERRVGRFSESAIQARHLFGYFGADIWERKFKYSVYDKANIGDKWIVVHPRSYSQVSGAVAIRLAEKFHRHALNAHGHFTSMRWDRSGEYMGVDLGGIFDQDKVAYINLTTTTHPTWNNGFGMLLDGYFYHFTEATDFNFWLSKRKK